MPIQDSGGGAAQFVAPLVETTAVLTFRLTVTDNGGATADGEVAVTVEPYGSLTVSVSGTVRSHVSHVPVSGALVTVRQNSDGTPHLVGEAVTDAGGAYAVEVPASPGRLAVSIDAEGFAEQSEIVALRGAASEPHRAFGSGSSASVAAVRCGRGRGDSHRRSAGDLAAGQPPS